MLPTWYCTYIFGVESAKVFQNCHKNVGKISTQNQFLLMYNKITQNIPKYEKACSNFFVD